MDDSITTLINSLGFSSPESFIAIIILASVIIGAIVVIATIRPLMDLFPFAYPNARVRARIGRLFTDKQISEILETEDLDEFKNYLRGVPEYSKYIDQYPIEKALESQLAESYELLAKIAPSDIKDVFRTQLKKWDIKNIKSLLAAKDAGLGPRETTDLLVPFGELSDELERLVDLKTVQDVVTALEGTEYGPILEDALSDYEETGMLLPLEASLDKYYMENLLKAIATPSEDNTRILHTYFGSQADITNIKIILRAKVDDLRYDDISPYIMLKGYQLREWKLKDLMEAENIEGVISGLEGTDYGPVLADALSEYKETGSLAAFERALEKYLNDMARDFSLKRPFGVGPMIGFLSRKEVEVRNLKVIARSKREAGFPESLVKEMLI